MQVLKLMYLSYMLSCDMDTCSKIVCADLFEVSLLEEDIANVEVSQGVVWVALECPLIVAHGTGYIPCKLLHHSTVGVQLSTGRHLYTVRSALRYTNILYPLIYCST